MQSNQLAQSCVGCCAAAARSRSSGGRAGLSRALFLAAMTCLVSACGQSEDARATDRAPARQATGLATASLRPGLYRVAQTGDVTIEDERCILATDVREGRFVAGALVPSGWTVDVDRMTGGRIALAARHPGGGRMVLSGTYQAEAFTVDGTLDMPVDGKPHRIKVVMKGHFQSPDCPDAGERDE